MYSKSYFKIFLLISIPLVLFSLILIYGTALIAPTITRVNAPMNFPYAEATNVIVNTSGVYVFVKVTPNGFNFTTTGGWALIVDTNSLGNLVIVNDTYLYTRLKLTPNYVGLTSVGVKGMVMGYLNGAPADIAFFSVVPVHAVNSITISRVYYEDCVLTITFNVSSLVPVGLSGITNMSLYTYYTHEYLFNTINVPFNESLYVPAGNHVINLTMPLKPLYEGNKKVLIYSCGTTPGVVYTLYLPINITYYYPTVNTTQGTVMFKVFTGG